MDYKDCKNLSNAEIRLYQENLKNEYEVIKAEIAERFKLLDEMDREYNKAEAELNNRRKVVR